MWQQSYIGGIAESLKRWVQYTADTENQSSSVGFKSLSNYDFRLVAVAGRVGGKAVELADRIGVGPECAFVKSRHHDNIWESFVGNGYAITVIAAKRELVSTGVEQIVVTDLNLFNCQVVGRRTDKILDGVVV